MSDDPTPDWKLRAAEQEARDAQATVLLKRVGITALALLLVWIAFVVWSFHG